MRIAVSAEDNRGLDSIVCEHFGRSPYFVLVDLDDSNNITNVAAVANPYFNNHAPGQVPAFINSQGANVMASGGMGGGAVNYFNQYGIQVVTGASGVVREVIENYCAGALQEGSGGCCPGGHGHGGCH